MSSGRDAPDLEVAPVVRPTSLHSPAFVSLDAEASSAEYSLHAESDDARDDLANVVVPAGMAPGSYVIVHEMDGPHVTPATAQPLPDVPYFGVIGTLSPLDSIHVFRMTVGTGIEGFQVALVSQQPASSVPLEFWLFDASGRVTGRWSSSDLAGGSPLELALAGQSAGATVFFGVSAANPGGPPAPIDFQLWVSQLSTPNPPSADPASPLLPAPATTTATMLVPLLTTAPTASQTTAPSNASIATDSFVGTAVGGRPAVGGLPTRSAGPSGGLLASDVANPPTPALAASLDTEGADQPLSTSIVDARGEASPRTVVALRGPGGFPLLGATALGNWRRASTAFATAPAEPVFTTAERPAVVALAPAPSAVPMPADPAPAVSEAPRSRTRGILRTSLSSGLGLATVLTLNVVLSDPIAGFDYLASRFDRSGRKRQRPEIEPSAQA